MSVTVKIPEDLAQALAEMHQCREEALKSCRSVIQLSSKAIRATHRQQFEEAENHIAAAQQSIRKVREVTKPYPQIEFAGYIQDAEKEMVEAVCLLYAVRNQPQPDWTSLSVEPTTYLHGLGEAASEGRRYLLVCLRRGDTETAERLMNWMEEVHDELATVDYPDGLTGGLRRTADALRAVVERTRSDMALTLMQRELMRELQSTKNALEGNAKA